MRNKNAIIYARRSTGNQEYSIEVQISACSEWALKNNYTVVETVIATISGLSKVREKLEYVINRARTEDMVIIVNTSERITRRIEDIERLEQLGLDLFRICEFELDVPPTISLFEYAINSGFYESGKIAERTKASYRHLKSEGKLNGWGQCKDRSKAIANSRTTRKAQAEEYNTQIQSICKDLDATGRYKTLAKKAERLTQLNYLSRKGKVFNAASLGRVLRFGAEIKSRN